MATARSSTYIVVGVDGSVDGLRAVEFAASEARARKCGVRLVHAYHASAGVNPMLPLYGVDTLREAGAIALRAASRRCRAAAPDAPVEHLLLSTSPESALVEASRSACLIVVGRRDLHGISRVLSGSTSTAVAAKAHCPVVSVPITWSRREVAGPIVVGVDGSAQGRAALAFAFAEASERALPLVAVRAWEPPSSWITEIADIVRESPEWRETAERGLAEDLAGWQEEFPEVQVHRVIEQSHLAGEVLVDHAREATMLVVGTRGTGGVPGLRLGAVARHVLAHSSCPVVVVRGTAADVHPSVNVPDMPVGAGA